MNKRALVEVVAGVLYNGQGEFLLSSRPAGKPYAGYWEFAGGKVEQDETLLAALQREFKEELNIEIQTATPWLSLIYDYEHARIHIHFFRIYADQWQGTLTACEQQSWRWQLADHITVSPLLPANYPILAALAIPLQLYGNIHQGFVNSLPVENAAFQVSYWRHPQARDRAVLVPEAELEQASRLISTPLWVIGKALNQTNWPEKVTALIWPISGETDPHIALLEKTLQHGISRPLLVLADNHTLQHYGQYWLSLGAHGLITDISNLNDPANCP